MMIPTLTLAMVAPWGLLRSRPCCEAEGPALEAEEAVDEVGLGTLASAPRGLLEAGMGMWPPVAWAAASRAEMEDIGSEPGARPGLMSRPAARAASISELDWEFVGGGFRSTIVPSKSRFGLGLDSNSLLSNTLLSAMRESGPGSLVFSEYFLDKSRKSRGSSEQLSLALRSSSRLI